MRDLGRLDYGRISRKLVRRRTWLGTRYYIGQIRDRGLGRALADQRRFLTRLQRTDARITVHLGRLESRTTDSPAARELLHYLARLPVRIDEGIYHDLLALARRHHGGIVLVEKAVDVMIAVDMVVLAERDQFDVAFLLSSDGDFTPAVEAVRADGKRVFAVSAAHGGRLGAACDAFIHIDRGWLADCYHPEPPSDQP